MSNIVHDSSQEYRAKHAPSMQAHYEQIVFLPHALLLETKLFANRPWRPACTQPIVQNQPSADHVANLHVVYHHAVLRTRSSTRPASDRATCNCALHLGEQQKKLQSTENFASSPVHLPSHPQLLQPAYVWQLVPMLPQKHLKLREKWKNLPTSHHAGVCWRIAWTSEQLRQQKQFVDMHMQAQRLNATTFFPMLNVQRHVPQFLFNLHALQSWSSRIPRQVDDQGARRPSLTLSLPWFPWPLARILWAAPRSPPPAHRVRRRVHMRPLGFLLLLFFLVLPFLLVPLLFPVFFLRRVFAHSRCALLLQSTSSAFCFLPAIATVP